MKSNPKTTESARPTPRVAELDEATLRAGHVLLASGKAHPFSLWIDERLKELEDQFQEFCTYRSVRKSIGR